MIRHSPCLNQLRVVVASILLIACDGGRIAGAGPPAEVDARPFVTGAAAASLGADGLFRLPEPSSPTSRPIVSPGLAPRLALSYVLSFGHALKRYWDQEHGRPIHIGGLKPDARVFYASTPYAPFPEGYHPGFAHAFGPFYLTAMNSGSTPVLRVAVAAYATEVQIDADGKISRPVDAGSEFVSQGIPLDTMKPDLASFVSPEAAVVTVAQLTGAKVSELPELMRRGMPFGPFSAVWKLTLDRAVRVRARKDGRIVETRYLYLGSERGRRLMIPAAEQPTEYTALAFRIGPTGEDLPPERVRLSIEPGHATVFEEAVVVLSR